MPLVYCKNCHQCGESKLKGDDGITLILFIFFIFPAFIYMMWRRSGNGLCSFCKSTNVILQKPNSIKPTQTPFLVKPTRQKFLTTRKTPSLHSLFEEQRNDSSIHVEQPITSNNTETVPQVNCPDCRELIRFDARKCKHCGSYIIEEKPPVQMISCMQCHKLIPNDAKSCSYCQHPSWVHKPSKNKSLRGFDIFIFCISGLFLLIVLPDSCSENTSTLSSSVQDTPDTNGWTSIPMSDSHENGRYFLISQKTENKIHKIKYVRKGVDSDAYGRMEIKCKQNKIRKASAFDQASVDTLDLEQWYTPTPDWTDQDIVNYICK